MPDPRPPEDPLGPRRRFRDRLLIALTFATGIVDALSFLGLGQIFTANMTGNTVFFAIALGKGSAVAAARSIVAIAGFAVGVLVVGRRLERADDPDPWPRPITRTLYLELVLAVGFAVLWLLAAGDPVGGVTYGLIATSSIAMGMQSAVGRKLAVPGVSTNVLTTAMTGLMAELAAIGISGPNVRRWTAAILAMAAGAAVGAALFVVARPFLPFSIVAVLAGVCLAATRHPR